MKAGARIVDEIIKLVRVSYERQGWHMGRDMGRDTERDTGRDSRRDMGRDTWRKM